ncbi:MAG: hypothetical protein ABI811_19115 [Acidobacteriota bacterium]
MKRDEVRKLLGGYATGSLTESERALLFDAALEDQDLFDELAGEQALKELLESPGAKNRLLAGLRPGDAKQVWWARPWSWVRGPWATAAGLSIAGALVWVMMPRVETRQAPLEVAQSKVSAVESAPAPLAAPVASKATGRSAPVAQEARKEIAAAVPAPIVALAPPPQLPPVARQAEAARAAGLSTAETVTVTAETALLKTEAAAPAAQLPKAAPPDLPILALGGAAKGKGGGGAGGFAADGAGARSNIVVNGQPNNTAALRIDGQIAAVGANAFTYAVTTQGTLRVVPLQNGVLEVTATGIAQPLFPRNPVVSGTVIEVSVPRQAQEVKLDFGSAGAVLPATERSAELSGTVPLPGSERVVRVIPAR